MKRLVLSAFALAAASLAHPKALVVYFSWGGTTEKMAGMIASSTGADLWKIEPLEPYLASYRECAEAVNEELERGVVRKAKGSPDFSRYETIFVGAPVWWHTAPTLVTDFLREHGAELSEKTVVPFCTYAATYRDETLSAIADAAGGAILKEGFGTINPNQREVDAWLRKIGEGR